MASGSLKFRLSITSMHLRIIHRKSFYEKASSIPQTRPTIAVYREKQIVLQSKGGKLAILELHGGSDTNGIRSWTNQQRDRKGSLTQRMESMPG